MAGFSNNKRPFSEYVSKLEEHGYVLLNAIGPLGFAVFLTFISDWWNSENPGNLTDMQSIFWGVKYWFFNPALGASIFLYLTTIGAMGQAKDSKALKENIEEKNKKISICKNEKESLTEQLKKSDLKLREEIENNYQLVDELIAATKKTAHLWICQIFAELNLTVKHRISIYYLDSDRSNLVLLDRFAKNHEFNSQGRPHFDRNQGVMGRVWSEGRFFEKKIPKFVRKNTNYYKFLENEYGFTRDVSSKLRMKSLTIGGFAIEDAQGHHIGVIIFESLEQEDFDEEQLSVIVKRENQRLVELITDTSIRDVKPSVNSQKEEYREPKAA